jgi:heme-degrading monooxygenase HmoA
MLCALTVRKLKPGSFEHFKQAFTPPEGAEAPTGWRRFYALRNVADEDEVITFGFFEGTLEELRAGQESGGEYERRRAAAAEFVESVGADGVFEVVEERSME